jgi:hypothetical protein
MVERIEVIFWGFDVVLLDSNGIRDLVFDRILNSFPKSQVHQLLAFHKTNAGLSRYVKFRFFLKRSEMSKYQLRN